MRGTASKNLMLRLEKEFINLSEDTRKSEYVKLKDYFTRRKSDVEVIAKLEEERLNDEGSNKKYFQKFFDYCDLVIDHYDKDEYLKLVLGDNYSLCVLKTMIPDAKYNVVNPGIDPKSWYTVKTLLLGTFAVKDGLEVDEEHIYSIEELVTLHNENKLILLSMGDSYQEIDSELYKKLFNEHMNNFAELAPLDFEVINNQNYLLLLVGYPRLFDYLREKVDFPVLSDVLKSYNEKLTMIVTDEIKKCQDLSQRYNERIENIKTLKKEF